MVVESCAYETERLIVQPWHRPSPEGWPPLDLVATVTRIMTEPVTRHLPAAWQGAYTPDRARGWIAERDAESPTLVALERSTRSAVGLVILHEAGGGAERPGAVSVRLGYLLAETAWGRGLATELVAGLMAWCGERGGIASLIGGVDRANIASRRVLERLGFAPVDPEARAADPAREDELVHRFG